MSEIGAVAPADKRAPAARRQPPAERDGKGSQPRRPRDQPPDADLVEVEPRKLDVEA